MADAVLADAGARSAIAADHHDTLFVQAGAGSGKTTELVNRLVGLVTDSAVKIEEVAAITFTDAAAAELRARVREQLEEVALDTGRLEHHRQRCRDALEALDEAAILTLHSFAQRILSRFPVEAELPPAIEIHDEVSSVLGFEERWGRVVEQLLADDQLEEVIHFALTLGVPPEKFQAVARHFNQNWDLVEDLASDPSVPVITVGAGEPMRLYQEALAVGDRAEPPSDDTLAVALRTRVAPWVATVSSSDDPYLILDLLGSAPSIHKGLGQKPSWGEAKAEVVELGQAARAAAEAIRQSVLHDVISTIGARIAELVLHDAHERRRSGRLEFHDLLVLARRLVRHDPDAHRWLHHRYRALLIDEFQDTDPIQVELAVRIAAPEHHPADADWSRIPVPPGRLFFVGDPKQSIYRFRRADIDIFHRARDRFVGQPTELVASFRSVPGIVAVVNDVFGAVMEAGPDQVEYSPLVAVREPLTDDPGPAVARFGEPTPHLKADELRTAEAAGAAAAIRMALREEWLVNVDDVTRPVQPADIAVLIPARTCLPHLESALAEAEIPYRVETGTLLYGTEEIADLVSVLSAIADPADRVALAGALRSPAYGCGDDDLFTWHLGDGRWSYLAPLPPGLADHPVARAFADLRERHDRHIWQSVPQIVEEVVRERRLMEAALVGDRARDAWRRYRVMIEHARQHADEGAGHLRAFLAWVELQRSDTIRASVAVLPERDLDAVRIMTIHGAKGLEFPMAVVNGLTTGRNHGPPGPRVLLDRDGFHIRMRADAQTGAFETHQAAEDQMDEGERLRLLYVALTRARDHLVVSTHHNPPKSGGASCHGQRLWEHLQPRPDVAVLNRADDVTEGVPHTLPLPGSASGEPRSRAEDRSENGRVGPEQRSLEQIHSLIDDRKAHWTGPAGTGSIAATAVAAIDEPTTAGEPDPRLEPIDRPPWRRGRAGTAIGRATHAVLQHVDLADPDDPDLPALARHHAALEGVPGAAGEVEAKARAALRHPLVREAAAARRLWREVPVAAPIHGVLLEGFVDLLFEGPDGLVVVDHKTDGVRNQAEVEEALGRYVPQGAAYALALEEATGRPVERVVFLFLRAHEAVAAEVPDLRAAVADVQERLGRLRAEAGAST